MGRILKTYIVFFQLHITLYVFKDKLKKALISLQNKFKRNISKLILISSFHTQEKFASYVIA